MNLQYWFRSIYLVSLWLLKFCWIIRTFLKQWILMVVECDDHLLFSCILEPLSCLWLYHENGLWIACNCRTKREEYNTDSEENEDDVEQAHGASGDENEGKALRTSENFCILLLIFMDIIAWHFGYQKLLLDVLCSLFALVFHNFWFP